MSEYVSFDHGGGVGGLPRFRDLEGEYELIRELGRGGTAVVYLARDRDLGRSVAIKVVRATFVEDPESAARLVREARTVAGLQHPNVVMLYGTRRLSDGSIALIMQYVPGRALKDVVRRLGPLPASFATSILRDVAKALEYAHERRIVHRDIKPENIYLDRESRIARLSDFGIARPWDTESGLTLPGVAIGTPAYMSPEQIDGKELDGRSDLYSLGLVGYEMLTGKVPWGGENVYQTIFKQKHDVLPPLMEARPDVPDSLELAISGCLLKDPARRWADAATFIRVLEGFRPAGWAALRAAAWTAPEHAVRPAVGNGGSEPRVTENAPTIQYRRDGTGTIEAPSIPSEEGKDVAPLTEAGGAVRQEFGDLSWAGPEPKRGTEGWEAERALEGPGKARRLWVSALVALGLIGVAAFALAFAFSGRAPFGSEQAAGTTSGEGSGSGGADPSGALGQAAATAIPMAGGPDALPIPGEVAPGPPAGLTVLSGDSQVGSAGGALDLPIAVAVRDSIGRPVSGVTVRFAVVGGGGGVIPPAVQSDGAGLAEARWLLGGLAGQNDVVATVQGYPSLTARFEARGIASGPARIAPLSGDGQRAQPASVLPELVRVRLTDQSGNPIQSSVVAFRAGSGGRADPVTASTNAEGIAAVRWRLGETAGVQTLEAFLAEDERTAVVLRAEAILPPLSPRPTVSVGGAHTCVLDTTGRASCWGKNDLGQLGEGATTRQMAPVRVVTGARLARLAAGVSFTCGVSVEGQGYCWGGNAAGQLGTGNRTAATTPQPVASDEGLAEIAAGQAHACALTRDGRILCWGSNESGRLGIGNEINQTTPTAVIGGLRYSALAVGWGHTCAVVRDGRIACWGRNSSGELGDGSVTSRAVPTEVSGARRFVALAAGSAHTCGLTAGEGQLYCWGQNTFGQLGDGGTENRRAPVAVEASVAFTQVVAGSVHSCALARDGAAYCWGRNTYGQLGDGTIEDRSVPVPVVGEYRFASLHAQGAHTCGQTSGGATLCWGFNEDGQLGDGSRTNRSIPARSGL